MLQLSISTERGQAVSDPHASYQGGNDKLLHDNLPGELGRWVANGLREVLYRPPSSH